MNNFKNKIKEFLIWSQKYTKTDMVYVAKGGIWWIIDNVVIVLLSFATMTAFSYWVAKEVFGAYQYIISIVTILGVFTLPGMQNAIVRAVAKGKEGTFWLCTKIRLKWSLIGISGCLAISAWYFLHQNFILGSSLLIASFLFPFPRIFNLLFNFWQARKRFDIRTKYSIIINVFEAIVFIPILFLTDNLILIMLVYFISRSLFRGIFFKLTSRKIKNKKTDKETIPFGKHLTLMQSIGMIGNQVDKVIIWQFLGAVPVALYSFALLPIQRIQGLIPVVPLALPKLSEKNFEETKKGVRDKFFKLFLITLPLCVFLILIAPVLYKILFPQYINSIPYFRILSLNLAFVPFSLLNTSFVAGAKKKQLYTISVITPTLKIGLFLALIPFYGIWGIIVAILIARGIESGLTFYLFEKL